MIQQYFGAEYLCWKIDADILRKKTFLYWDLKNLFETIRKSPEHKPNELIGDGGSIGGRDITETLHGFKFLYDSLRVDVHQKFEEFNASKNSILTLDRFWVNEVKFNAMGRVHHHPNKFVLIFYFNVSEETSHLVFIDPKHKDKIMGSAESIDDSDKFRLKVSNGMCILHDGNILHSIEKHENIEPRYSFVFEFSAINTNTKT